MEWLAGVDVPAAENTREKEEKRRGYREICFDLSERRFLRRKKKSILFLWIGRFSKTETGSMFLRFRSVQFGFNGY